MSDDTTIGQRLQAVRKRRGLTQAELADRSGVSVSLIRQIEQGQRDDTRLETARKLAAALRVPTTALIAGPDAAAPDRDDISQWEPVRHALEGRPGPQPPEPPTLAGLTAALHAALPLLAANQYAEVRAVLPTLLRDADALVASSSEDDESAARDLRSQIRQVTSHLMIQTWQFDTAGDAIQMAIDDASDPLTTVTAIDEKCWALIRAGRLAETREVATRWADDIEPRISRATRDELAGWGLFLLRVSSAAVRDNRPGEAQDALRLARVAAIAAGPDITLPCNRIFGPAVVAIIQAENAMIEDRPDVTLAIARQIEGRALPLPRYYHRHRLDVASAHVARREYAEATVILQEVRRAAPEWLVQQRYARDILHKIIDRRRTLTPEMRELASFVRLPY